MSFLIAATFTDSLARLTRDEQKLVKTTAFDLQLNPASPGHSFHKLDRARDKHFWSVRVGADLRMIVHRASDSMLLCYVDHHDKAYTWAERRKLEAHPTTGAAQFVEVREMVVEITTPRRTPARSISAAEPSPALLFADSTAAQFLEFGVPEEWIPDALVATEDSLFELAAHLPAEAAEALLQLATGGKPTSRAASQPDPNPFSHPDALRRFRVLANAEELERAFAFPWEKWSVFLHPSQLDLVERRFAGPARVAGSAGTGKTVVALHRAVSLARLHPAAKILLTTFSITLARVLAQKLERLTGADVDSRGRITVNAIDEIAINVYEESFGTPRVATEGMINALVSSVSSEIGGHTFGDHFLEQEWTGVVDAWNLQTWEQYRDVARLGRKNRLTEKQRAQIWPIFESIRSRLNSGALVTMAMIHATISDKIMTTRENPFDFAVVDESQDVSMAQLRFLAALAGDTPDGLFFAGDLGQRIFQTPFSWKSLGVDVRGRSSTLRVNYRTSHQIRSQADRLLPAEVSDVDGLTETRGGTVSVFNGMEPSVQVVATEATEVTLIGSWIRDRVAEGIDPNDIAVFVRSANEVQRAADAIAEAGLKYTSPLPGVDPETGRVVLMPMHLAKGMEFRAVVVVACDEDILPHRARIEAVTDDSDLEDVYNTERHLLYVACTRARDHLLVTAVAPGSEFLADLTSTH